MAEDIFDKTLERSTTERPSFRQAPPGAYLVTVRSVKPFRSPKTGTNGLEFVFTMREAVHSDDMTGVDLSRCLLKDTQWVTENSLPYLQERFERISKDTVGKSVREALDYLPGCELIVDVSHETHNSNGDEHKIPFLKVNRYYSVDYYMNKKLKQAA